MMLTGQLLYRSYPAEGGQTIEIDHLAVELSSRLSDWIDRGFSFGLRLAPVRVAVERGEGALALPPLDTAGTSLRGIQVTVRAPDLAGAISALTDTRLRESIEQFATEVIPVNWGLSMRVGIRHGKTLQTIEPAILDRCRVDAAVSIDNEKNQIGGISMNSSDREDGPFHSGELLTAEKLNDLWISVAALEAKVDELSRRLGAGTCQSSKDRGPTITGRSG